MEKMYDLTIEHLNDGMIRLEQSDGCPETSIIDLHPLQVRMIAECAGLLPPAPLQNAGSATSDDCIADEMHHLSIDKDDDGTIHLFQTQVRGMGGSDEHVMLHRVQAVWLASRLLTLAAPARRDYRPAGGLDSSADANTPPGQTNQPSGDSDGDLFT